MDNLGKFYLKLKFEVMSSLYFEMVVNLSDITTKVKLLLKKCQEQSKLENHQKAYDICKRCLHSLKMQDDMNKKQKTVKVKSPKKKSIKHSKKGEKDEKAKNL